MKFSIRDLLFVTAIVAILVAWWVDHRRQTKEINELKKLKEQSTIVDFSWIEPPRSSAPAPNPPKK